MSSFGKAAKDALSRELVPHGFAIARSTYAATFVAAVRREAHDVALYVYLRDSRRGSAGYRADLWCAPIDAPDDRVDKIGVGFKVLLHQSWEESEVPFLLVALSRARILALHSASLVAAVEEELSRPINRTNRFPIWRAERQLLSTASSAPGLTEVYQALTAAAHACNGGRASRGAVEQAAQALLHCSVDVPTLEAAIAALPSAELAPRALVDQVLMESLLQSTGA